MLDPLTKKDVSEFVLAFNSSQIELDKIIERLFPFYIECRAQFVMGEGFDICWELFGKRFMHFDNGRIIEDKCFIEARWEWYQCPYFRTAEDAMMFKLAFNPCI
jgi:hypothetical protein